MSVKLLDVARHAGVGYGTASRAMSGKGSVSAHLREKVLRAATELGFQRNAAAAALASSARNGRRTINIALLAPRSGSRHERFLEVCRDANVNGHAYDPKEFKKPEEMLKILWSRGIDGLCVDFESFHWSEAETAAADWSQFSVVKYKRIFDTMPFYSIRHSAYDYMRVTLLRVLETRPRRVAILLIDTPAKVDNEARLGAILSAKHFHAPSGLAMEWRTLVAHRRPMIGEEDLLWLARMQPDVIVGLVGGLLNPLRDAGWRFPQDAGFAAALVADSSYGDGLNLSGCLIQSKEHDICAINALCDLVARGERGFMKIPTDQVIEPVWNSGDTLPAENSRFAR